MYGCKNRAPYASAIPVQDGWYMDGYTRTPRMVSMPFRMSPTCQYRETDLGEKDEKCHGCIHRASSSAGAGAPTKPVQVGDSLADLRKGEGGPVGVGGQADVGKPSDAAEQRRHLEQIWPGAAAYQPTEE